ncbi:MAG TPA: hypothetical protein VFM93_03150 [Candidatus Limnocylindria bacterium]|nr:hypothetical protein [Candidatus Limnocylindria bacterium]
MPMGGGDPRHKNEKKKSKKELEKELKKKQFVQPVQPMNIEIVPPKRKQKDW